MGWYVDPRNQKDLMQTKNVKNFFRRGRLRGWYASPRIQKDLMQTKKVSNSDLRLRGVLCEPQNPKRLNADQKSVKLSAPDPGRPAALPGAPVPSAVTLLFF